MSNKKYAYNYDIEECNQLSNALKKPDSTLVQKIAFYWKTL